MRWREARQCASCCGLKQKLSCRFAARPTFFARAKKGRQRNTPRAARLRCAQVRSGARDFPRGHPVPSENAAHPCAAPCGSCPRPSAVPHGGLKVQSRSNHNSRSRCALALAFALVLDLLLPYLPLEVGRRTTGQTPRATRRTRVVFGRDMDVPFKNSRRPERTFRAAKSRPPGCAFFGLPFFAQAKKGRSGGEAARKLLLQKL